MTSPVSASSGAGRDGVAAARHLAGWLALAATPTFAGMAVLTITLSSPTATLCGAGQESLLGGMMPMYLLMSAFHAAAWLRLVSQRGRLEGCAASSRENENGPGFTGAVEGQ